LISGTHFLFTPCGHLDDGNPDSNDRAEDAEIHEGNTGRQCGQYQEGQKDQPVDLGANDVRLSVRVFECRVRHSLSPETNRQLVQWVTADQVEQWEQEDPHNVDKVPVQAKVVDGRCMPLGISALRRFIEQRKQD